VFIDFNASIRNRCRQWSFDFVSQYGEQLVDGELNIRDAEFDPAESCGLV
jgi:hypothetical protein